jgi:hypothetical protein
LAATASEHTYGPVVDLHRELADGELWVKRFVPPLF